MTLSTNSCRHCGKPPCFFYVQLSLSEYFVPYSVFTRDTLSHPHDNVFLTVISRNSPLMYAQNPGTYCVIYRTDCRLSRLNNARYPLLSGNTITKNFAIIIQFYLSKCGDQTLLSAAKAGVCWGF